MPKMVQIEGVSVEELLLHIRNTFEEYANITDSLRDAFDLATNDTLEVRKAFGELLIDRKFIKRNLTISDRRISKYEREGVLVIVPNLKDTKTTYYRFADFEKLIELEHRRHHPNIQ